MIEPIFTLALNTVDFKPFLALGLTIVFYIALFYMGKKGVGFGTRTLLALVLGLIVGLIFRGNTDYVGAFGRIFTRLISAIVIPLLFFSIMSSITSINDTKKLKSLGSKSVFWLLITTAFASMITIIVANFLKIGKGFNLVLPADYVPREVPSIVDTIINFFPSNIVQHAANNEVIPFIIFTVLMSIALVKLNTHRKEIAEPIIKGVHYLNKLVFEFIKPIINLTPYAVVSYIASAITRDAAKDMSALVLVVVVAYVISLFQMYVVHGTLISIFAKMSPIKFFKAIWPAQVVAFTSQSSIGTIPVTVKQLTEELDVSDNVASFVSALGANVGMPACTGMWPVLLAIFSINALNIPFSTVDYILLVFYSIVVSFGTAGVPGTATIAATAVLAAAGLPIEVIMVLAPISSLVDMVRTATNVTGAATAATIVDYRESKSVI